MITFPEAKILDVNLTNGEINTRTVPGEVYRLYPGGSALGCYLILQEKMNPSINPLSPDALMAFSVSPTVGLPFSGNSRMTITAKSPLTGAMGDSQSGGYFPAQLRANGWDSILLRGKSLRPVYLYIDNNKAVLKNAMHLWGKTTLETEACIKEELQDDKVEISEIGPAGENLVRYACVLSMGTRANGRNGMGAVMGSKLLKAVVCKRQKPRKPYDPENFSKLFGASVKDMLAANAATTNMGKNGTNSGLKSTSDNGFLMTRNGQTGCFPEGADKITGNLITETILVKRESCYACAIRCKRAVSIPDKGVVPEYGGPEYESAATLGAFCGVSDLGDVCLANQLCNMYGLDTISAGATIAFVMECYEKGLINDSFTGGLNMKFGNGALFETLLKQIAFRSTPFGNLLAEGSACIAEKIGKGAEKYFMGVKKQEFPAHMARFKQGFALHYSVNVHGADHASCTQDGLAMGPIDSEGRQRMASLGLWKGYKDSFGLDDEKVRLIVTGEQFYSIADSVGLCVLAWGPGWHLYGPSELVQMFKFGLGCQTSMAELLLCGERRINMMRYFNYLAGFRPEKDDALPPRVFEPLPDGPCKGLHIDRKAMDNARSFYYELIGSDPKTGRPSDTTLRKLSLQWLKAAYEG